MIMVTDDARVVSRALASSALLCPFDDGVLRRWGFARRRFIRGVGLIQPRRARCRSCLATHVLLPTGLFLRRGDGARRIGLGIELAAAGVSARAIAKRLDAPRSTVRRWLSRIRANSKAAGVLIERAIRLLDPLAAATGPAPNQFLGLVAAGERLVSAFWIVDPMVGKLARWSAISLVTKGKLLAPSLPTD